MLIMPSYFTVFYFSLIWKVVFYFSQIPKPWPAWRWANFFFSQGLSCKGFASPLLPPRSGSPPPSPAVPSHRRHARNCTLLFRSRALPLPSALTSPLTDPIFTPSQAAEANLRRQLEQTLAADPSIPLHHYNLVRFVLHCINLAVVVHALRGA